MWYAGGERLGYNTVARNKGHGLGFAECVSYALFKLQMTNISLKASSMEVVYNGHDVFVWLPTGYGKSLC